MEEEVGVIPDLSEPPVSTPKSAARKRPRTSYRDVWVILNPHGDVWTTDTFETPETARTYIADFWRGFTRPPENLDRFAVVRGRIRASAFHPLQNAPKASDGNGTLSAKAGSGTTSENEASQ